MTLFIDGDAFPNSLKAMVCRAINRLSIPTIVISNKQMSIGFSDHVTYTIVGQGEDEADDHIVELVQPGDMVITGDIPLAARVIKKDGNALSHHGTFFDEANIGSLLATRDLMKQLRDLGQMTGGPAPYGKKDVRQFANKFSSFLAQKKW